MERLEKIIQEVTRKMREFAKTYHMIDLWKDHELVYSIPYEQLFIPENIFCLCAYVLCLEFEGRLDESDAIINQLPEKSYLKIGLQIANPTVSWKEFYESVKYITEKDNGTILVVLTAGRPYLLNGFNDFSRIGFLLPKHRQEFISFIGFLYPDQDAQFLYNLCLAEYYYQINKLFEAEILVSKTIHALEKNDDLRMLFVALFLQAKILRANGTVTKSGSYVKEIRQRVKEKGISEFYFNIDAVEVYNALFDGDYSMVNKWMAGDAPDEYGNFNMLDLFRYMVKMRCYLVDENPTAVIALAEKLRPYLEKGKRHIDICEIDLLESMAFYSAGDKKQSFLALERSLKMVKRRQYYRLVADEGTRIITILIEYIKEKGETDFLMKILDLTRNMAVKYPLYLKPRYKNNQEFSKMEIEILNLLQQGKSKEEIADYFFISVNTVKYHMKKIYAKLGASTPHHAVWHARLLGLIK